MAGFVQDDKIIQHRDGRLALIDGRRRPKIEHSGITVGVPFPRLVDFRQQVEVVKPLRFAISIAMIRLCKGHALRFRPRAKIKSSIFLAVRPYRAVPFAVEFDRLGIQPGRLLVGH